MFKVPLQMEEAFTVKEYKHTHTPPPAYTQIYTHTQVASKSRSKSVCGFSIVLILKGVMTF